VSKLKIAIYQIISQVFVK